ncbi:MAG: DUF4390 domain-containing protein [Syntrophobacterales bacterium]|nr:MAG: DUF4390 domain-containing protein [Syntrophobacterales bacterium]
MKRSLIFAVTIISSLIFSEVAISKEASIEGLTIELNGQMQVSFSVINCCTEKLEEAIRSGVPTTFTFRIKVYRKRKFWRDKKMVSLKFKHRIKYDNITKEYQFHFEENEHNLSVKDFEEAKEIMARVTGVKLIPTNRLEKGRKYHLDVKAELDPVRLPFGLHRIFFFLSIWDVETDWLRYEFTY